MRAFWGGLLLLAVGTAQAGGLRAVNVLAGADDSTRVVLETPARAPYHVFTLANPDRVVIDLHALHASHRLVSAVAARGTVRAVRESVWKDGTRIVFDLSGPVTANTFVLSASGAFGNRIIVDLTPKNGAAAPALAKTEPPAKPVPASLPAIAVAAPVTPTAVAPSRPIPRVSHAIASSRAVTPSPLLPDPKLPAAAAAPPPLTPVDPPPPAPVAVAEPPAVAAPAASVAAAPQLAPPPAPSALAAASSSAKPLDDLDAGSGKGSEAQDAAILAAAANAARLQAAPAPSAPTAAPSRAVRAEALAATPSARPVARVTEGRRHGGKAIIVAIDAGHGGHDPGAVGFAGVQEKDVCLAMARKLAALVDAQPGMHAVLTRDDDTFVELRQRMVKARAAQADVFVSIHANSYRERSTHGAAVYVLSAHGASSEQARWVANHENAADLVGGVDLQGRDEKVAAVLLDISQSATMEASFDLAGRMLDSLHEVTDVDKPSVQQAGFMVLKSPDIPSILIETAFITNAQEERALASEDFEAKMAHAILQGLLGYFDNYRPQQPGPPVQTAQRISAAQPTLPPHPPLTD